MFKFVLYLLLYFGLCGGTLSEAITYFRVGWLWIIPALLYLIQNGLYYSNINAFTPGTYKLLMSQQLIWSGVLSQLFLGIKLTKKKWIGLFTILFGLVLTYIGESNFTFNFLALFTLILQSICAVVAGLFQEIYLKRDFHISITLQNLYLACFSIILNLLTLLVTDKNSLSTDVLLYHLQSYYALAAIFFVILGGLFASLIMKHLSLIWKEIASSCQIFTTALLHSIIFKNPLEPRFVLLLITVSSASYLYQLDGTFTLFGTSVSSIL